MNGKIRIVEVGPRDGFQSIEEYIPLETKAAIIDSIVQSGVRHIEFTSFVNPKVMPQMADAAKLAELVQKNYSDLDLFPLVPNLRGAAAAYELGLRKVAYVVSLSQSHNQANIRRTHGQSLDEFIKIRQTYPDLAIVVDVATVFGCPFEGVYDNPGNLIEFLIPYVENGLSAACLCDTIGIADPQQVRNVIKAVQSYKKDLILDVHIHDTRNMGMVNTLAAIECGVTNVQSTLGGLGGCPFAPGASGNLATEDLVYMLNRMGFDTGVDFNALVVAAKNEFSLIKGNYSSHSIHIEEGQACGSDRRT